MTPRSRSAHFAIHHVAGRPAGPVRALVEAAGEDLSTGPEKILDQDVDNLPHMHWLGSVIPKRHARHSVTRNLLKRQVRAAMARHAGALPPGLWLVRLRAPFSRLQFVSAASAALRGAARAELEILFAGAAGRIKVPDVG